jgi:hypothetical protein
VQPAEATELAGQIVSADAPTEALTGTNAEAAAAAEPLDYRGPR